HAARGVGPRVGSGKERTLEASDILVAAGRTPNTDRLDAAKAGVELDARGYIRVNDRLQTTAPDVWATGECAGSPQFTHVGEDDCRVVLDNLLGGSRTTRGRLIPYCLFTDPELAHVGLTESEARAKGVPYRIARMPMAQVFRTHTLSETRGFMKALIGADDRILGFTALGAEASELMAVCQTAMAGRRPLTGLRGPIRAHPTPAGGLLGRFAHPPPCPARGGLLSSSSVNGRPQTGAIRAPEKENTMNALIRILARSGLLKRDLDLHLVRGSMVLIFLLFGYQKWFEYEAQGLMPFISNGPLTRWMYPVFGLHGATYFLGVSEWLTAGLLIWGFWNPKAGILGAILSVGTFVTTVTIIPFMPGGWDAPAGFPAVKGNVAFLMKDV